MKKYYPIIAIVVIALGWWYIASFTQPKIAPDGYKNATYVINGENLTLVNGHAEKEIVPGSASKLITQYFGNEAVGDLNGDGLSDIAFLLTQSGGGSGTFYYAVAALQTPNGYTGTNGILLGDKIAPQNTEIRDGKIIVNYADRKPSEPMTTPPSIGVSKYLKVDNGNLLEFITNATYMCKDEKTIQAEFYKGGTIPVKPGEMPIPTGKVFLKLSDGRAMTLPQTISASGARYANTDESIVFWNKGNTAFIAENNVETYSDCVTPGN